MNILLAIISLITPRWYDDHHLRSLKNLDLLHSKNIPQFHDAVIDRYYKVEGTGNPIQLNEMSKEICFYHKRLMLCS